MKICILLYHLDLGGVEKTAVELANELINNGHEVHLKTIYKYKPEMYDIDPRIKTKSFFGFYFKGLNALVSLIPKSLLYKFIVGTNNNYDVEIAFQAELPTEIIGHSRSSSKKIAWIHGLGVKFTNIYDKFDTIYFVGSDLLQHYKKNEFKNFNDNKLHVLYNRLSIEEVIKKSEIEVPVVDNENIIEFITVGRLSSEKRFDRLLKSFSLLVKSLQVKNIHLSIVGSGALESDLKSLAKTLNLDDYVTFHGYSNNPYPYIKAADVYVCSSDYEGFNVAVSEAAVLGTPIVSTDVFGAKELLGNNNEFGIVVLPDEEALMNGMKLMLDVKVRQDYEDNIASRIRELIVVERNKQLEGLEKILEGSLSQNSID